MLEVLSFCDRERAQTPPIKITVLTFLVKKCNKTFRDYYFLRRGKKTSESSMLTNLKVSILELLPAKEIPAWSKWCNICRVRKQHEIRDKKSYYPENTAYSHRSTPSGRDIFVREFKIRRLRTTTTVKHAIAHDQKHVTVHFSRVVLRLRWVFAGCWAVSRSRDYGEHFSRILPSR